MPEVEDFKEDKCKTATDKNKKLSTLLRSTWPDFEIVKIERTERDGKPGWQITYRE
jgi:hypothetical protein